ncbi:alcohol acetyltransferase FCK4 like protein [Verticillium longisporum]|nr:alcohol acetyltransferase FCK4 like protein [Verticillium longisporum]KAG7149035.1 alcohol acetyltransferase FCK4 like protein [Verticillium longisporum]
MSENLSEEVDKPVWAGVAILLASTTEYRSRVRLITIPNNRLLEILDVCKRNRTALTGLLHGLICVALRRHVEDARAFRSVTPYSVRKFTNADAMDILNHISFMTQYVPSAMLEELQATETGSPAESSLILKMASAFASDMKAELGGFPNNNAWANVHHITDLEAHCRDQIGTACEYTYELSNLGSMRMAPTTGDGIILERLIFTQCGMVAGPALGFNCASVQGGPLIISITWQDGIVEENLVKHVARELEQRLITASDTFATE